MSVVQSKNGRETVPLKPIQPTQFWTFDNALTLLKSCHDPYILDALDEFLLLHSKLLFNPLPFSGVQKESSIKETTKEITLRSIIYTEFTTNNIQDAKKLESSLQLDVDEIARVINQSYKRIPENKLFQLGKLKSKLPDDREKNEENKRLTSYTRRLLRERRLIIKIVIDLLNNKTNSYKSNTIQNLGKELFLSPVYLTEVIKALSTIFESLVTKPFKSGISEELDEIIGCETVLLAVELSKVLVELLVQNPTINNEARFSWFELMNSFGYVSSLGPYIPYPESFSLLQALSTVISILFLDLENSYDSYDSANPNTTSFIANADAISKIHSFISDTPTSNPVVLYSWSLILLRKYYFLQEYPSLESSSSFTKSITIDKLDIFISELSARYANHDIFGEIKNLSTILRFDNIYSAVLSSVIISSLPLVTINDSISNSIASVLKYAPNSVVEKFFENESTINAIILSRAKFPIALTPYLKIASINGNFAFHEFNELKSYIHLFKKDEFLKSYEIDEDNTELVKLSNLIDVYPPYESTKKISFMFDVGTKAKILPSSNKDEVLVTFLYKYNGWSLLGRVLQNASKLFSTRDREKLEFVVNILELLIKVVKDNSIDDVKLVLESMSAYTEDSDVIEVILRLLEQGLHARNVEVVSLVINLLTSLMPILSYRIWPCLAKSALLSKDGKEGIASTIFGTIEMVNGEYKVTNALINLTDSLVQNCLSLDEDYPSKSKSLILNKFVSHLLLVFESSVHCKFKSPSENLEISVLTLDVFSNILAAVHSIEKDCPPAEKATKVFADASGLILDSFLVTSEEYARSTSPILRLLKSFPDVLTIYEINDISGFWYDNWIRCALSFSQLIVKIRSNLNYSPSAFESHLFRLLPNLVSTYAQYDTYRKEILDLITCLTNGVWTTEQPSVLSHLGQYHSQMLLHSLASDLDNSFDDYKIKVSVYDFICAVMEGNQEGLSVLFISGRDVFGDFTKTGKLNESKKNISLLQIMKKNVRDMKYYPNSVSLPLIDAISLALNSWTTAHDSDNDSEFINELIARIQLELITNPQDSEGYLESCYELKLSSKIAQVLSLYLFTSKNQKCTKLITDFISSDSFIELSKKKFSVSGYHPSLHNSLQSSFSSLFPHLQISQFTSTLTNRNRYGVAALYNLPLMDSLLKSEPAWTQLREQVIASSINLQYLNAQISSSKSFGALLTSYCRKSTGPLSSNLVGFVTHLLKININEGIPTDIFEQVYQERIELAFYLFYSLYNRSSFKDSSKEVFNIIKYSLDLLSSTSLNLLSSLAESKGYYRPLLKILYCSLSLIKDDSGILIEYFSIFRDLFALVVAKGTRTLLIELQNEVYLSRSGKTHHESTKLNDKIDDLMVILSILKVFVTLKSSTDLHLEIATIIDENGTINALLNLYSFSHSIEVNDENIFAQLSLMYIQELMSIPIMAEKCVSSGLFLVLGESQISKRVKAGGLSVATGGKYHALWINGILPIITISLTNLHSLPEIYVALQLFGKQIDYCISSWSADSASIKISTAMIAETSQILLIYDLLKSLNITAHINQYENNQLTSNVDMKVLPGLETESKRDEFRECFKNLLKHPKFLISRISPSSVEEQRIIEKGGENYDKFVSDLINEIRNLNDFE
ncbi:nucleoporin subcomplex protein binding to Pom34-domain-containing protein [Scheffersomyces coipomensis]|uniref:nucleoporin subcomplex protein binding to Pom34-domain-containing protein n=1 Tax=Scheffersomyces coipomensis TaxID=1788519 RepID=UPI00315C9772